jgi:hypothetical protein
MPVEVFVRVRARKRTWTRNYEARAESVVTAEAVTALFGMRKADAARSLGIAVSTLQRICRRLGIERWPLSGKTRRLAAEAAALGFFAAD